MVLKKFLLKKLIHALKFKHLEVEPPITKYSFQKCKGATKDALANKKKVAYNILSTLDIGVVPPNITLV
jgi:hypothetical protein